MSIFKDTTFTIATQVDILSSLTYALKIHLIPYTVSLCTLFKKQQNTRPSELSYFIHMANNTKRTLSSFDKLIQAFSQWHTNKIVTKQALLEIEKTLSAIENDILRPQDTQSSFWGTVGALTYNLLAPILNYIITNPIDNFVVKIRNAKQTVQALLSKENTSLLTIPSHSEILQLQKYLDQCKNILNVTFNVSHAV